MTPFDCDALVAMLRAFYPVPSGPALEQAFRERPAYFAGGRLIGHAPDALLLPDGRIKDLILDVSGPPENRRWQCITPRPHTPSGDDLFPLEDGPLTVMRDDELPPRTEGPRFVDLWAEAMGDARGAFGAADGAGDRIAAAADPVSADRGLETALGDARANSENARRGFDGIDVSDVVGATDGLGRSIPGHASEYEEPAPPEQHVHDPGPPPDIHPGQGPDKPQV